MSRLYPGPDSSTYKWSDEESRVCFDMECSFPYGPTCQTCSFNLDLKKLSRSKLSSEHRTDEWTQEVVVNVQNHVRNSTGPIFFGGADERDNETKKEREWNESSSQLNKFETDRTNHGSNQPKRGDVSAASSLSSSIPSPYTRLGLFEEWLSDLFSQTLQGHLEKNDFVGGAEDENLTEFDCPLCSKPLGDPSDQHLSKCTYAHMEQESLKLFVRNRRKRTT